jgi:hypothetical protein
MHARLIAQGGHRHRRREMHPAVDPGPCLLDIFGFQQYTRPPTRHLLTLAAGLTNQGGAQLAGRGSAVVCLSSSSRLQLRRPWYAR